MNYKAFGKYYLDISFYNLCFSTIIAFIFSVSWGFLIFATLGNIIGFLSYYVFQKQEYYLYYNLGFTKTKLLTRVVFVNLLFVSIPLVLLLF